MSDPQHSHRTHQPFWKRPPIVISVALVILHLLLMASTVGGFGYVLFNAGMDRQIGMGLGSGAFVVGYPKGELRSGESVKMEWKSEGGPRKFVWIPTFMRDEVTFVLPMWLPMTGLIAFLAVQRIAFARQPRSIPG